MRAIVSAYYPKAVFPNKKKDAINMKRLVPKWIASILVTKRDFSVCAERFSVSSDDEINGANGTRELCRLENRHRIFSFLFFCYMAHQAFSRRAAGIRKTTTNNLIFRE